MTMPADLETLREIFKDKRVWTAVGKITAKETTSDRSVMRVKVLLLPDNHEIVARVAWDSVGPNAGNFGPISTDDMVLVCLAEGLEDHAYVVARLSSRVDKIPEQVLENHTISKSLEGKRNIVWGDEKVNIVSPNRINLATADMNVLEPLILGLVQKALWEQWFKYFLESDHIGICILGPVWLAPEIRTQMLLDKQQYITDPDTNILSQLSFTERGGS